ncbi:reverse transcriptase domain-containing protein [Artemisia annua]|uniref:Reverse transcriptase domain-containing protein n=1 Tax=Artemisia annua TaxID=35608 RepID=A0A2U1MKM5_ARTAN|nr:reverse transcriptase domain-containing protein [Artemisia annua]
MLKGEGSEGKQPKSGKEKNPKKGSFAFACVHCRKNNYKYPQEVEISSGESSDMNTDKEADNIDDGGNDQSVKLPKRIRIPHNITPYDRSKYPVDHVRVFQTMERVYNWDAATQCHMFKRTLRGLARVWFEHLPKEFLNGFHELRDAFLESFLSMKRYRDRDKKIRCAKRGRDESIENFTRRFLTESRRAKKMPEAAKVVKFMEKVSDPELIKYLHWETPWSIDEVVKITEAYCRAEEAAKNLRQRR